MLGGLQKNGHYPKQNSISSSTFKLYDLKNTICETLGKAPVFNQLY